MNEYENNLYQSDASNNVDPLLEARERLATRRKEFVTIASAGVSSLYYEQAQKAAGEHFDRQVASTLRSLGTKAVKDSV